MRSHAHSDYDTRRQARSSASRTPILDAATERELVRELAAGSDRALQRLIASHMRLVVSIAERHTRQGVGFEDLISEGVLGLMEAARRFDPDRGTRFGTYAAWWVRAFVRRYALSNRRIVPAPSTRSARKVLWALRRTERTIAQRTGRDATREEVAAALGVQAEEVAAVQAVLGGHDVALGQNEDGPSSELPCPRPSPEEVAADAEARQLDQARVRSALSRLDAREREVVRLRILEDDTTSLASLGESFGVSRERVRQIQQRAQMKLRNRLLERVA